MSWLYLLLAGAFEIVFALSLKYSAGFTRLWPSLAVVAGASASLWLMTRAMRQIPVGTAYAVWTGIGALGVAVLGMGMGIGVRRAFMGKNGASACQQSAGSYEFDSFHGKKTKSLTARSRPAGWLHGTQGGLWSARLRRWGA